MFQVFNERTGRPVVTYGDERKAIEKCDNLNQGALWGHLADSFDVRIVVPA